MKQQRLTLLFLGNLACASVGAQVDSAGSYFNQASKEFVKVDKIQALRTLDKGLQQYPGDPRLLKLAEELLKDEENKQQQQQQQKEQQQQQEQEKDQQQQQDQEQQERDRQRKEQEARDRQEQQQQGQADERPPQDTKEGAPKSGTIAPQDAMRMLDALERSEKDVQEKVQARRRPASRRTIQKDW